MSEERVHCTTKVDIGNKKLFSTPGGLYTISSHKCLSYVWDPHAESTLM